MSIAKYTLKAMKHNITLQVPILMAIILSSLVISGIGIYSDLTMSDLIQEVQDDTLVDITIDLLGPTRGFSSSRMDSATSRMNQMNEIFSAQTLGRIDSYSAPIDNITNPYRTRLIYSDLPSHILNDIEIVEGRYPQSMNEAIVAF
ncbi:MAG: hypothetical protein P1Q69_10430, partial [Candidatus Thorarchaeota archaeon]|nr:hypothetical protein [Candidatus Thorarchaeota archaeon]